MLKFVPGNNQYLARRVKFHAQESTRALIDDSNLSGIRTFPGFEPFQEN